MPVERKSGQLQYNGRVRQWYRHNSCMRRPFSRRSLDPINGDFHCQGAREIQVLLRLSRVSWNARLPDRASKRRLHRVIWRNSPLSFSLIYRLGHYEFRDHEIMSRTENNTINYETTRILRNEG